MNFCLSLSIFLWVIVIEIGHADAFQSDAFRFTHPAVSVTGEIAFDSDVGGTTGIYVLNRDRNGFSRISPPDVPSSHPAWSRDGKRLAYESRRNGNYDVFVYDFVTNREVQLTFAKSDEAIPQWHPNGDILFESNRSGKTKIYRKKFGSKTKPTLLTEKVANLVYPVWSPDGKYLLFSTRFDNDLELCIADSEFKNVTRLTKSKGVDAFGAWSSDGKQIAFTSRRTGSNEIFLINRNGNGLKQITFNTQNSALPEFLPDDSGIVFMSRQNGTPSAIYSLDFSSNRQSQLTHSGKSK